VGALAADGIDGISRQFNISGQSLQSFRQTVIENSVTFARMNGLVSRGADTFFNSVGKLANPTNQAGDGLRRLGLSTDDIVETGAAYVRQQILLGRTEQLNQRTLTTGTTELATEMDRLSKLTGAQRKQVQEQREAALREGVFGAAMREMELEGRTKEAKAIQGVNAALENLVSPQVARGFRDLASGFPSSDDARKLVQSTGGAAQAVLEDLKSGRIGDLEAINRLREAAKNLNQNVQQFAKVGGDAAGVYLTAYEQQLLATLQIKDATELEKKLTEIREKQQAEQKSTTNTFVEARKQFEILNRQINLISFKTIPYMATAINKFTAFVNTVIKKSAELLGIPAAELGFTESAAAGRGIRASSGGTAAATTGAPATAGPYLAERAVGLTPEQRTQQIQTSQAQLTPLQQRSQIRQAQITSLESFGPALTAQDQFKLEKLREFEKADQPRIQTLTQTIQNLERAGQLRGQARASMQEILNLVGRAESRGNYTALFPNGNNPQLTSMTLQEVMRLGTAAGKYQIIPSTMQDLIDRGFASADDIFNSSTQDKLATELIKQRKYDDYLNSRITGSDFADNLSDLFAALPNRAGVSAYPNNRATVSRKEVVDLLGVRYGGVMSGPMRGYQTTLHGTEAVIPLTGGRSIPIEMPAFTENLRRLADIMTTQTSRFDELIDMMRINNNLSKDMVRYQRA
jgi:hypothetical protein